jgi:MOSC domain-containing protein
MHVAELWRYPVKSMAGERLEAADLGPNGIPGDRVVHVQNRRGRLITARSHPALLGFRARLGPDGEPLVDGRPWPGREVEAAVRAALGDGARLVRDDGPQRFDVLPLLIATDGSIAALGVDHRRLRPNIVVAGVAGLAERTWPGRRLRIGSAVIRAAKLRRRCVMTTYDPDTLQQDMAVLERIAGKFSGRMALDCEVLDAGRIALGDPVILLDD